MLTPRIIFFIFFKMIFIDVFLFKNDINYIIFFSSGGTSSMENKENMSVATAASALRGIGDTFEKRHDKNLINNINSNTNTNGQKLLRGKTTSFTSYSNSSFSTYSSSFGASLSSTGSSSSSGSSSGGGTAMKSRSSSWSCSGWGKKH